MASLTLSIGLISLLNRREEVKWPILPVESTDTGTPSPPTGAPKMLLIKQLLSSLRPERNAPIQITLLASATPLPAPAPTATLLKPVELFKRASKPLAVLL